MDPVTATGLAASIAALIEVAVKIAGYVNSVRKAPKERSKLAAQIYNLFPLFHQLNERLENATDENPWFRGLRSLGGPRGPLAQFKEILTEIEKCLRPETGMKMIEQRLSWKFDEKKCNDAIQKIERLKSQVSLALSQDIFDLSEGVKNNTEQIKVQLDREEGQAIFNWFSSVNFLQMQEDIFSRREEGTGSWILISEEFQKWLNTEGAALWCPGIPGAGKTVLASIITNHLRQKFCDEEGVAVASIFFNYKEKELQTSVNILSSLLAQLILTPKSAVEVNRRVRDFYELHKDKGIKPTLQSISKFLKQELAVIPRAFIIVDALDECPDNPMEGQTRSDLLEVLLDLPPKVNILMTSRPLQDLEEYFEVINRPTGIQRLDIEAKIEDVKIYVRSRITQVEMFKRVMYKKPGLQEDIVEEVSKGAQKMFLVARLHMDSLLTQGTVSHVKKTLNQLPSTLDGIYGEALTRIEESTAYNSKLAVQVLSWVSYAQRPLTLLELQHAIAIDINSPELDHDELPDEVQLTSVCGGLVTTDGGVVRLVHYTAQEYFGRLQYTSFSATEAMLSKKCLAYLCFAAFAEGYLCTDQIMQELLRSHPFLEYAATSWGHHSRRSKHFQDTQDLVLRFLKQREKIQLAMQVAAFPIARWAGFSQVCPKNMNALHVAANAGLEEMTQVLLLEYPELLNQQDSWGRTPLYIAAHQGFIEVVRVLLKNGADPSIEEESFPGVFKGGRTALFKAAQYGHSEIVELLLDAGAFVNKVDKGNQTALHWASWRGQAATVDLLLERGADHTIKSAYGRSALFFALWSDKEDVARLIFKKISDSDEVQTYEKALVIEQMYQEVKIVKSLVHKSDGSMALGLSMWEGKFPLDIALELELSSLVEKFVLTRERLSGHWMTSDLVIRRWEKEIWYPDLEIAVQSCNAGAVETHACVASAICRERRDTYWSEEQDEPYLQLEIPGNLPTPVCQIEIRTVSHDQGWSDKEEEHNTYISQSWFEAALKPGNQTAQEKGWGPRNKSLQHNVCASSIFRTQVSICNIIPASNKWRDWTPYFIAGNIVQIFPKAACPGWTNHVKSVEIRMLRAI